MVGAGATSCGTASVRTVPPRRLSVSSNVPPCGLHCAGGDREARPDAADDARGPARTRWSSPAGARAPCRRCRDRSRTRAVRRPRESIETQAPSKSACTRFSMASRTASGGTSDMAGGEREEALDRATPRHRRSRRRLGGSPGSPYRAKRAARTPDAARRSGC